MWSSWVEDKWPFYSCHSEECHQNPLYVSVPQTVDEGVKHGHDHSVHQWPCCTWVWAVGSSRAKVYTDACTIKQGDNREMRHTGGKSSILSLSWWDSMYGGSYFRVRVKYSSERTTSQQHSCNIYHYIIKKCVRTGKSDHMIDFTVKVRDFHLSTEG